MVDSRGKINQVPLWKKIKNTKECSKGSRFNLENGLNPYLQSPLRLLLPLPSTLQIWIVELVEMVYLAWIKNGTENNQVLLCC